MTLRNAFRSGVATLAIVAIVACSGADTSEGDVRSASDERGPRYAADVAAWEAFAGAMVAKGDRVEFETWASDQDVYVKNPCAPGDSPGTGGCAVPQWPDANAPKRLTTSLLSQVHMGMNKAATTTPLDPTVGCTTPSGGYPEGPAAGFPADACVGEEVRRDRKSFDYIVARNLFSKAGLKVAYGGDPVSFPNDTVQLKADWIAVSALAQWIGKTEDYVREHFYISRATVDGTETDVAMTSMHVSIKTADHPDWIWANFENADIPGRCDQTGCNDSFGLQGGSTPVNSSPWQAYGTCARTEDLDALLKASGIAAVFGNYCLTGTQLAYNDPDLLGSPVIEGLLANVAADNSSCISCHRGASFDSEGAAETKFFSGPVIGNTTVPEGGKAYDFMWGVLFAN